MKRKYALQKVRIPYPVIAVIGGIHLTDYLPNDISSIAPIMERKSEKTNTHGYLTRSKVIKKTEKTTKMKRY